RQRGRGTRGRHAGGSLEERGGGRLASAAQPGQDRGAHARPGGRGQRARNRPEGAYAGLTHAPPSAELSIASRTVGLGTASSRVAPWAVPSATERRKLYASMTLRSS